MARQVLRGRPSDHPYLHKDFHGALSFAVDYVEEKFGEETLREFLQHMATAVYSPLIARATEVGLDAIRDHLCNVFTKERGEFEVTSKGDELVFEVQKCPAIWHMREHGYCIAKSFCETTRIVNETIAKQIGAESTVEYDQEKGSCVQRFRLLHEGDRT